MASLSRIYVRLWRSCQVGLLTFGLAVCEAPKAGSQAGPRSPISVSRISTSINSSLVENSIGVTSVSQRGLIFGLNDSGHRPELFALDSTGTLRGQWTVPGARNRDWEAAALGPCPASEWCLYIGDVGDNEASRPSVDLYRIPEPRPGATPIQRAERLRVRYADGRHDVEAMYVGRDGSTFLITKRRLRDETGRPRPALVFRVRPSAWGADSLAVAQLVDSLPVVPGSAGGRQVTDAALSADGERLAVRTYAELFVFEVDSSTWLPRKGVPPATCAIRSLRERQGEGIGWWWDDTRLLLTSEGRGAPLQVVSCP